jgi:hypothetical protein
MKYVAENLVAHAATGGISLMNVATLAEVGLLAPRLFPKRPHPPSFECETKRDAHVSAFFFRAFPPCPKKPSLFQPCD